MWLLDTQDNDTPRLRSIREIDLEADPKTGFPRIQYAIFSHTWAPDDEQEISFDDIQSGNFSRTSTGWRKIQHCRRQAAQDGLEYAWIDTCCIDKRSSAELQEAINSMFHWYSRSNVCYVFLTDVSKAELDSEELATHENCKHLKARDRGVKLIDNAFTRSLWFSRGWTLQELLAPKHVYFYDKDWQLLGDKKSLQCWVSRAAGIDGDVLRGDYSLQQCSVAMRMSWAASRRTTRIEDRAYSLLGIFDVNMPMLYGEGSKAFMRLQEEIIKTNDDQTIFVWESDQSDYVGMLAPDLDAFQGKGEHHYYTFFPSQGFSLSNRGLLIKMPLVQWSLDIYIAVLCCGIIVNGNGKPQGIYLQRLGNSEQYGRVRFQGRHSVPVEGALPALKPVYVRQRALYPSEMHYLQERDYEFGIDPLLLSPSSQQPVNILLGQYRQQDRTISQPPGSKIYPITILSLDHLRLQAEWLGLGFDHDFHPVIVFADSIAFFRSDGSHLELSTQAPGDGSLDRQSSTNPLRGSDHVSNNNYQKFLSSLQHPTLLGQSYQSAVGIIEPVHSYGTYWACKCYLDKETQQFVLLNTRASNGAPVSVTVTIQSWSKKENRALWQVRLTVAHDDE
ncbi:Vegetative incompatibility protein HET-E-1 [Cercospora beticola]|uniref:Vegetative incompatibility protein HET-E-1 n=1 Tax=Cercospora beticola TaxID=122368 RepID=A0A2G5HYP8_CERBT|nr:Vegetative incompatibility protein HET-E-1 [Cercospora beticola]PIA97650.1 Vegetative incompatibility protein HET-E-1 [Cercospora beticola]WPA99285.1 hypothetical protein RHO25_003902 [Cercospora beticola]